MRTRLRASLDADLDIAVRAFNGTATDRRIWARIAWRVGVEEFHHALINKLAEDAAIELVNEPTGWNCEAAIWRDIRITANSGKVD